MKDLTKWQIISFISRGLAMALGLIQSFVIVRILSVSEWGIVQIAVSIGGAFGIYQHLGLASGSTREISAAKNDTEIFKIFVTSCFIRYLITLPIAFFLFFASYSIAVGKYTEPSLVLPIRIYAVVLIIQGIQSILNSVISGTQRFKQLFVYQSLIALASNLIYIPFVFLYKVNGYFYALLAFNLVSSLTLAVIAFKPMKIKFALPSRHDFRLLLKELLSISLAIYVVKIIYTLWEKSGPLLLGLTVSKEMVGIFAFALLYAKKIVNISDAATDVSLPVFSEKYVNDLHNFKSLFVKNFDRLFTLILFSSTAAVYWAREVVRIAVGGNKYDASLALIVPMVFAFTFYSFINLIKSSIIVPAKLVKDLLLGFIILITGTILFYAVSIFYLSQLQSMAYAMLFGAFVGLSGMVVSSQKHLKISFINHNHVLMLVQSAAIISAGFVDNLVVKSISFVFFTVLFIWAVKIAGFIDKEDVIYVTGKLNKLLRMDLAK